MMTPLQERMGKHPRDLDQLATASVGGLMGGCAFTETDDGDPTAVVLVHKSGLNGGLARAAKLGSGRRREIDKQAARARWAKAEESEGGLPLGKPPSVTRGSNCSIANALPGWQHKVMAQTVACAGTGQLLVDVVQEHRSRHDDALCLTWLADLTALVVDAESGTPLVRVDTS